MTTDHLFTVIGRADELYSQRAEPGAVRESVMVLSGAQGGADRYEVQWRLARAFFFLGQEAGAAASGRQLYATGISAGERAIALNDDRVEGHFWVGVNLALFAEANGGIRGVRALRWARLELKRSIEIDEAYHGAGPLRVLARLDHKAPRILGGNRKRSRALYDRALAIAPSNTVTLIYAAQLAIASGERERAFELLKRVLDSPVEVESKFEIDRDRELARSLMQELVRS